MEYSFIHFAGTLWTASEAREPDGTIWHTTLPLHPADRNATVILESSEGAQRSISALDLASVLLLQQPKELSIEASPAEPSGEDENEDEDEEGAGGPHSSATRTSKKWRPLGSVAALTSGLRAGLQTDRTQSQVRASLEAFLAGLDSEGWVTIENVSTRNRPWSVRAVNPPPNFQQKAKSYATEVAAKRNAERLIEELRIAHAARAIRIPRRQVKLRLQAQRHFSVLEILRLADALGVAPTKMLTA